MTVENLIRVNPICCKDCGNVESCQIKRNYVNFIVKLSEYCDNFINLGARVEVKCDDFKEKIK